MKLSDVKKLFAGAITIASFKELIKEQVAEYERLHEEMGSHIPIIVEEDEALDFGKEEFLFLCQAYIDGQLTSAELAYISDAFTLAEEIEFPVQLVRDELEYLCYFDIDKPFPVEEIKEVMEKVTLSA